MQPNSDTFRNVPPVCNEPLVWLQFVAKWISFPLHESMKYGRHSLTLENNNNLSNILQFHDVQETDGPDLHFIPQGFIKSTCHFNENIVFP